MSVILLSLLFSFLSSFYSEERQHYCHSATPMEPQFLETTEQQHLSYSPGTATSREGARPTEDPTTQTELEWRPTKGFLLAFTSLQLIVAVVSIESTSLPPALPVMSAELGGTALQAFWAGTSYLLTSTVIQLPVASMSHILGRKIVGCVAMTFTQLLESSIDMCGLPIGAVLLHGSVHSRIPDLRACAELQCDIGRAVYTGEYQL